MSIRKWCLSLSLTLSPYLNYPGSIHRLYKKNENITIEDQKVSDYVIS